MRKILLNEYLRGGTQNLTITSFLLKLYALARKALGTLPRLSFFYVFIHQLNNSSSALLFLTMIFLPSTVIKPSFCILISSLERDGLAVLRKSAISCLLMETDMDDLSPILNNIILAIFCLRVLHDIISSRSLRVSDFCAISCSMFEIKFE